jgi:propionate CoA-transferase
MLVAGGRTVSISKVVSARDAVSVVHSDDYVASSGWGGHGVAESVLRALEERFLEEGRPRDLNLVWAGGQGDGSTRGLNHLGHEGLLKRTIGGHYGLVPRIVDLAVDEKIEAYNLPEGVIINLFRNTASGSPGVISSIGIGTFVDPRQEGGKVNRSAEEDLVELLERGDQDLLFYVGLPIDVAIIRGTTADPLGNVTIEHEATRLEILELAMAARASGGYVICQVDRVAEPGSLDSRHVRVPGVLVDAVVVASNEDLHQTWDTPYDPALSGEIRIPVDSLDPLPLDARTVVARRAAWELTADSVVNVGLGLPELVGRVAGEEDVQDLITFTIDTGVVGGVPLSGFNFGAAVNREAVLSHTSSFDFIDGGGLDFVFLGVAEVDGGGNVNVSRFGQRIAGCGGSINLTQRTRNVVFMTTFTSGGLEVGVGDAHLVIRKEGRLRKFVDSVSQITFSGNVARARNQSVRYVTERCVFELAATGLRLIELAPGVDLDNDVLRHLPFEVEVDDPAQMPKTLFGEGRTGLRETILDLRMQDRLDYDAESNTVFMDYSGMHVRSPSDVRDIVNAVDALLSPLGRRVHSIVNYDRFHLDESAVHAYAEAVRFVEETYYVPGGVTRHSTNAFIRLKLGRELSKRRLSSRFAEFRPED